MPRRGTPVPPVQHTGQGTRGRPAPPMLQGRAAYVPVLNSLIRFENGGDAAAQARARIQGEIAELNRKVDRLINRNRDLQAEAARLANIGYRLEIRRANLAWPRWNAERQRDASYKADLQAEVGAKEAQINLEEAQNNGAKAANAAKIAANTTACQNAYNTMREKEQALANMG